VAATWAGNLDAAQAASASGLPLWQWLLVITGYDVMPLALVRGIKDSEAESQLVKQLLYSGIVRVLGFT
jgi:hypothetical protein